MDGFGSVAISFDGPGLPTLVGQVVAWLAVTGACVPAVRRTWARFGIAGGLVGLAAAVTVLVDGVLVRRTPRIGAQVFDTDSGTPDLPGFIAERGLANGLAWVGTGALGLLACAFALAAREVAGSVRRREHGAPDAG